MITNYCKNILGSQLLDRGLINYKQLMNALKKQEKTNQRLATILRKEGIINGKVLYKILSNRLNNPSLNNKNLKIKDEINSDLIDSFDARVLIEKKFLPININKNILKIIVFDFKDKSIDRLLKTKFGDVLIEKVETASNVINYLIEYTYRDKLITEEIDQLQQEEKQPQKNLFTKGQLIFIGFISIIILTGLFFNFILTIKLGLYFTNIFFFTLILFKFVFPFFFMNQNQNQSLLQHDFRDSSQEELPLYTVLVPLINKSYTLDNLILSLKKMDYPAEKMEVIFLLKNNDNMNMLLNANLPENWQVIEVPKEIMGKRCQMNDFGLQLAKGEYITFYEDKDLPDPNQLKKAFITFNKKSKDCFCLLAPYKYMNNKTLLSKYLNLELTQIIKFALSKSKFYDKLSILFEGTSHYKTDKLKENGGWKNHSQGSNPYSKARRVEPFIEVFNSVTYSFTDNDEMNYYINLFKTFLQELLYYNRNLFHKIKHNYKHWFTYNFFLFNTLLIPLLYIILGSVLILKLVVNTSVLNQYFLNNIINISIVNFLLFYLFNLCSVTKLNSSIKVKEKIKISLIKPIFMIMKFYALIKGIVKLIKNPYKLELTNPDTHRDLMFMHINFKNKSID